MEWMPKVWGRTRHILATDDVSIWDLDVLAGGYCSKHRHATRANLFVVVSGTVDVEMWFPNGKPTVWRLTAGAKAVLRVPAGVWHRFTAVEASRLVEMYMPDGGALDEADIEREDVGGLRAA